MVKSAWVRVRWEREWRKVVDRAFAGLRVNCSVGTGERGRREYLGQSPFLGEA